MYVDDTHLTYAVNDISSIEASLNQDLSNINRRLIVSKLTLNKKKNCIYVNWLKTKTEPSIRSSCHGNQWYTIKQSKFYSLLVY